MKNQINENSTDSPATDSNRDAFETYLNSTYVGDSLKKLLRLSPEPFNEDFIPTVPTVPEILFNAHGKKQDFSFKGQSLITIGRKDSRNKIFPSLDLNILDGATLGVSRRHAQISYMKDSFYLMDLGSSNGTWINDRKAYPRQMIPIYHGDILRFGELKLSFTVKAPSS